VKEHVVKSKKAAEVWKEFKADFVDMFKDPFVSAIANLRLTGTIIITEAVAFLTMMLVVSLGMDLMAEPGELSQRSHYIVNRWEAAIGIVIAWRVLRAIMHAFSYDALLDTDLRSLCRDALADGGECVPEAQSSCVE
jgi:hypothetical protein